MINRRHRMLGCFLKHLNRTTKRSLSSLGECELFIHTYAQSTDPSVQTLHNHTVNHRATNATVTL
jgi:hypothetical protein